MSIDFSDIIEISMGDFLAVGGFLIGVDKEIQLEFALKNVKLSIGKTFRRSVRGHVLNLIHGPVIIAERRDCDHGYPLVILSVIVNSVNAGII